MKEFIIGKINILLSVLLVGVLGLGAYLGYAALIKNDKAVVPDFLGKDKQEVIAWCGQLSDSDACEFIYEDTSNTEKDKVFQQSVSAGKKLEGKITFRISSGIVKEIDALIINENTSKADIENWKSENGIVSVNYIEENSDTIAKGMIIRIEPSNNIKTDTVVNVYISKGKKDDSASSDNIEVKSGAYLNLSEAEFIAKAKELGLSPNHRTSNDASSSSIKKGNIVWHGSGSYKKGETINYGLCTEETKGIAVKEGAYIGKSESEFKTIAEGLKLKAVHNSDWDEETSDSSKVGTVCRHGYSNNYEENENLRYGLYKLKSGSTDIVVNKNQYVGKSEDEFKTIASNLGLKANHDSGRDAYSSTAAKGSIVTHGYGTYEKNETFNYGLSLGPQGGSSSTSDIIIVKAGQYIGKTEAEFKTIATDLGLTPNHKTIHDSYSSTVAKGNIVWHGSGTYEKDEAFNYGLSLGAKEGESSNQTIQISQGQLVGKTEAEFISAANALGLNPTHVEGRDAYSSTVAKGSIVTHGYGSYVKNEAFNYGLSLGPESQAEKVTVDNKSGSTEAAFKTYIEGLGLKLGTRSEEYSSTVSEGSVISHDTGSFSKGSSINYKISKGSEPENTASIMRPENYAPLVSNTFEGTKSALQNALGSFTNVEYIGVTSTKAVGQIESIEVNGAYNYAAGSYPVSTPIKVSIVSVQSN